MRIERQHRVVAPDHLPVPEVDAIELSDGDLARPGLGISKFRHLHGQEG
jgi:hypothetical protein